MSDDYDPTAQRDHFVALLAIVLAREPVDEWLADLLRENIQIREEFMAEDHACRSRVARRRIGGHFRKLYVRRPVSLEFML